MNELLYVKLYLGLQPVWFLILYRILRERQESTLEHLCKHCHHAPEFFATFGGQSIGTQI